MNSGNLEEDNAGLNNSTLLESCFSYRQLFLAVLGLRCCMWPFSSCDEWGLLFIAVHGIPIAVASLVVEHGL